MNEGYVTANERTWYDVCVKCGRVVSPRHTSCPRCGGIDFKGSIRSDKGYEQKQIKLEGKEQ